MLSRTLRKTFSFPVMLASIIALWVYMAAGQGVWDPDIWWHLKNAEYLFQNHKLPDSDLFSFTMAGHPWLNHEWLAEIPYYLALGAVGLTGVYILFLALLVLILFGNFYWAWKTSQNLKGAFLVGCTAVPLATVSFGPRTLLFGYIFMVLLLLLLWKERTQGGAPLWTLPLLFCVWINFHGSWLFGMIILGIFIASGIWEGSWGRVDAHRWQPGQLRRLLGWSAASVAALFVNPMGHRLVLYPIEFILHQKLNVGHVDEWASVDFNNPRGKVVMAFLAVVVLGVLLRTCRWKLEEVLLAGFGLYLGLTHIRFLFLMAILTAPFVARLLDQIPPYRPEIDKPVLNAVIIAGILAVFVARFPSEAALRQGVEQRYPASALAYMEKNGLRGRTFHDYMWGGYIVWHAPWMKTFIDGRTDIFEIGGVLRDYLDVGMLRNSFGVLDKYEIEYVMIKSESHVVYLLEVSGQWQLIYKDGLTTVFARAEKEKVIPAMPVLRESGGAGIQNPAPADHAIAQ